MLDEMPGRERRDRDEPWVRPEARQEHEERDEDERVPDEVDPFDVELADDPLGVGAGKMQHVDLDHLRDVLQEVRGLAQSEETEEGDPRRGDEPVDKRRRARGHAQSTTPANRRTSSMMSSESRRTSRTASVIVATSIRPPRRTGSTPDLPATTCSAVIWISGTMMRSAPPASPPYAATQPVSRPIASTTTTR